MKALARISMVLGAVIVAFSLVNVWTQWGLGNIVAAMGWGVAAMGWGLGVAYQWLVHRVMR